MYVCVKFLVAQREIQRYKTTLIVPTNGISFSVGNETLLLLLIALLNCYVFLYLYTSSYIEYLGLGGKISSRNDRLGGEWFKSRQIRAQLRICTICLSTRRAHTANLRVANDPPRLQATIDRHFACSCMRKSLRGQDTVMPARCVSPANERSVRRGSRKPR